MLHTIENHWIGGQWHTASSEPTPLHSPVDDTVTTRVSLAGEVEAEAALAAARTCALDGLAVEQRVAALRELAERLEADAATLAPLITRENGCPSRQAESLQVSSAVGMLRAMADIGEEFKFEHWRTGTRGGRVLVQKVPIGVSLGIVPWNVPIFLAAAKLASALLAGCPLVLKPSPENAASMTRFAEHIAALALPAGAINVLIGDGSLGAYLVAHPAVAKVSFTGSTETGRRVAESCARRIARCTLELGGKSAAVLLDDVNVDEVREQLFLAMLQNNGQVCGAQSRVLVPRSRYDDLRAALAGLFEELKLGDPSQPDTDIGPVAGARHAARIAALCEATESSGGQLVNTLKPLPAGGAFIAPRLYEAITPAHRLWKEEVFGPVIALAAYDNEAEAVALANDSPYGLSGSVWSADPERALDLARMLRTGTVGINSKKILDFGAPFGGFGESGIGREFGPEGIDTYLETKSILTA